MSVWDESEIGYLEKLPKDVRFSYVTDSYRDAYTSELKVVDTPDKLVEFAKRWRELWLLPMPQNPGRDKGKEQSIIDLTFDPVQILECIGKNRKDVCEHLPNGGCASADFLLPYPFLMASLTGDTFGVSTNLALLQLTRAADLEEEK